MKLSMQPCLESLTRTVVVVNMNPLVHLSETWCGGAGHSVVVWRRQCVCRFSVDRFETADLWRRAVVFVTGRQVVLSVLGQRKLRLKMNTVANQTSVETRKTIVTLHCQGLSVPEVARKLGVSAIIVQTLVDYYQSIINRSQHKHPISLQDRAIVEAIRANPNITAAQLKEQCNLPFSLHTVKHLGFDTPPVGGSPGQILRTDLTGASVKRKIGKDSEGSENSCMKKKCTLERKGDEVAVDVKHEEREEVKMEVIEEALEEERDMFDVTTRIQIIDG
ncbi:hypothetical protein E2C01_051007 [Portunus trituberculatus]|uniref:Uncharacterized protein n=1 Tax=Portunus trituberculatus TaxID=210409 RepID=A0A5B7GJ16_PORTR|nr:hypothetical protein [Portunus trituberculatus]